MSCTFPALREGIVNERILNHVAVDSAPSPLAHIHHVAVGSKNPVKVGAVRAVLTPFTPSVRVEGISVASTVADQPFGDDETIRGALARASAARDAIGADLGIGIEGGVVELSDGSMRTCAWAAIVDRDGRSGV